VTTIASELLELLEFYSSLNSTERSMKIREFMY